MKHLFFNIDCDLQLCAQKVFSTLGVDDRICEGDSSHVREGIYYFSTVFGVQIKLEYNSYDYDDVYKYMIAVKKHVLSQFTADEEITDLVAEIVIKLLRNNLRATIAVEDSLGSLKILE